MKNIFVKLSKHSFIRIYDEGKLGYILNQRTELDRVYNDIGADFLSQITRTPRSLYEIVNSLLGIYKNVSREAISNDFLSFIEELHKYGFVEVAESINLFAVNEIPNQEVVLSETHKKENPDNQEKKSSRYFWFKHDATNPILRTLHVELTSKCNERCIHCFIPSSAKDVGVNMSLEHFKTIVDQFREMGGLSITLSGGEPILNKNVPEMLSYCRQKDLRISLFSNLLAINNNLIQVMKDVNMSNVQVSLYSIDSSTHDEITQIKGSFEKTFSAIERLKENDIPVTISCPLMKTNKDTMGQLIKFARSKNIFVKLDYIIMAQSNFDKTNLANRMSIEETEKALRDIIENDIEGIHIQESNASLIQEEDYQELPLCSAATHTLCISANGNVSPCVTLTGIIAGNVYKQSLMEIWNTSEKLKLIRSLRQRHFQKCISCEAKKYCKICIGQNYCESGGDIFKISQNFCDIAFLTKRVVEECYTR